jgi:hypothetical protein
MELLEERQTRGFHAAGLAAGVEKRIAFLDPVDRKLLEMTLTGKLTRREAAVLVGRASGNVTRRIHTLLRRLHDPVVTALVRDGKLLPEWYREVGLAFFLRKTPAERIMFDYAMSRYEVRKIVTYIRGWVAASRQRR